MGFLIPRQVFDIDSSNLSGSRFKNDGSVADKLGTVLLRLDKQGQYLSLLPYSYTCEPNGKAADCDLIV